MGAAGGVLDWLLRYASLGTLLLAIVAVAGVIATRERRAESRGKREGGVATDLATIKTFMHDAGEESKERDERERKVSSDIASINSDIVSINSDIATIKTFMHDAREESKVREKWERKVEADIGSLKAFVRDSPAKNKAAESASPLRLTDYGVSVARAIGAHEWASQEADGLGETVRSMEEWEIADLADDRAGRAELSRLMRKVSYEEDMPILLTREVLGLVLRDKLLEMNEMPVPGSTRRTSSSASTQPSEPSAPQKANKPTRRPTTDPPRLEGG